MGEQPRARYVKYCEGAERASRQCESRRASFPQLRKHESQSCKSEPAVNSDLELLLLDSLLVLIQNDST